MISVGDGAAAAAPVEVAVVPSALVPAVREAGAISFRVRVRRDRTPSESSS